MADAPAAAAAVTRRADIHWELGGTRAAALPSTAARHQPSGAPQLGSHSQLQPTLRGDRATQTAVVCIQATIILSQARRAGGVGWGVGWGRGTRLACASLACQRLVTGL